MTRDELLATYTRPKARWHAIWDRNDDEELGRVRVQRPHEGEADPVLAHDEYAIAVAEELAAAQQHAAVREAAAIEIARALAADADAATALAAETESTGAALRGITGQDG